MSDFWNQRFASAEYIYGTSPNNYFKACIDALKPGTILVPGAGEGRDAVYAATLGWDVHAFDSSSAGKEKTLQLATERHVAINYAITDAAEFTCAPDIYDAIGMTYFHLPPSIRGEFHRKMADCLKPGGILFLEVFTPAQLNNTSGGPKDPAMLYTSEMLAADFASLVIIENIEEETILDEGTFHKGKAAIVRFKATKKR